MMIISFIFQAQPHSLMALSMEAAANCYRFDPRDILSYHREIDDCHLHAGALTSLDYGKRIFKTSMHVENPSW